MDHELGARDGGGERERRPRDGGEGGDGAVGERVGQRAEADHAQELEAVVLEGEAERREARVVREEAVDVGGEDGAGGEEGAGAAEDGGAGDDEPPVRAGDCIVSLGLLLVGRCVEVCLCV